MKKVTRCIVVGFNEQPMVFAEERTQFVYIHSIGKNSNKRDFQTPLRSYTIKEAKELIERHEDTRRKAHFDVNELKLIPFYDHEKI